MAAQDHTLIEEIGQRIADLRKRDGMTQVQLAEVLGCSQQRVVALEKGRLRVPVTELPTLSRLFGVSIEALLGLETEETGKRGPTPKLQRQLEELAQLPRGQQRFVSQMLDTVLQQHRERQTEPAATE